jgi:c-di-GMP-related signal transduction protein
MRDVLEGLALEESARTVLLENAGPLSPVYDLILAVEAGVWPRIAALASQLGIDQEFLAQSHWTAMEWAQSIVTAA